MDRYCVIESGVVGNIVKADAGVAQQRGYILAGSASIGDTWDGVTFTRPEPDPAVIAEQARVAEIDAAISGDTTVQMLKAMSNAQFDAWWTANVTTLAQASNILKRLARVTLRRVV